MRWQLKALTQQVFSRVPGGTSLNELAQEHVTRGLKVTPELLERIRLSAARHWQAVRDLLPDEDPQQLAGYEFGAGWHLGVAVALSFEGVGSQVLVDRSPLARPDLVCATIAAIAATGDPEPSGPHRAEAPAEIDAALSALGIRYLAPRDARATGLPAASVDFVTSTSTLEHIPEADLDAVLRECHRLLRPGGVLSAIIDYGDHYAHADASITSVNFLKYGPRQWKLYSPALHFQNRLRHSDHVARIANAGFEIVVEHASPGNDADRALVASSRLHAAFFDRDPEDLIAREGHIVARRAGSW